MAYALADTTDIDLLKEPLGNDKNGKAVYLKEIWPTAEEVEAPVLAVAVLPEMFQARLQQRCRRLMKKMESVAYQRRRSLYDWNAQSTYIQEPPFLIDPRSQRPARSSRSRTLASPRDAGRFRDDGPHFASRIDRLQRAGRTLFAGAWRSARPTSTATEHGAATTA